MRSNPGTRLIAAAALTLGLSFSLTGCQAGEPGRDALAAQNVSHGIYVSEQDVQIGVRDFRDLLKNTGGNDRLAAATPENVLQSLALRPLMEKAMNDLGIGVSRNDARTQLMKEYEKIRAQRPGAKLPEPSDQLVDLVQYDMLNTVANGAPPKDIPEEKMQATVKEYRDAVTTGWTFGPRYGGFEVVQTPRGASLGPKAPSRSFLAPYLRTKVAGVPEPGAVDLNGRPMDEGANRSGADAAPEVPAPPAPADQGAAPGGADEVAPGSDEGPVTPSPEPSATAAPSATPTAG